MDYNKIEVKIHPREPWGDLFIDALASLGCDSFEETETGFNAYLPIGSDLKLALDYLENEKKQDYVELSYNTEEIQTKNWNEVWESSFEPIYVEDWCSIVAPFHKDLKSTTHKITITPKMSFGTGHHETTFMMIKAMKDIDFKNKSVLDMGCGTAVLAILSKKLGSANTDGVDIEDWAVENAIENCTNNNVDVNIVLGGKEVIPQNEYNIILANINRNILLDQLNTYANLTTTDGYLLMSGFLSDDEDIIKNNAISAGFNFVGTHQKNNWLCLVFTKK